MTKEIQLTQGYVALVDAEDFERLSEYSWHVKLGRNGKPQSVATTVYNPMRTLLMHRVILNLHPEDAEVDHINRNPLDNRKDNLRLVSRSEQMLNSLHPIGITGFRGVSLKDGKFMARIVVKRKHHYLGTYQTAEEAARAYDLAARELHGEYANTNF